ncbi:uncharacterized protein CLUP02_10745 [Colletotrichum lupini]|uniref:Uncharacterized protein n=1 Tax=Colletotrichum lupini TaxID=145971 RepID=A0A9Q8SXX2_9PEZI|nr:uncharacterized protein CLUP02_10745 [Colletotrichum lupini]UQC85248.1 hypothetical protein CLUP02_10745 [Colletotrichum lupini]
MAWRLGVQNERRYQLRFEPLFIQQLHTTAVLSKDTSKAFSPHSMTYTTAPTPRHINEKIGPFVSDQLLKSALYVRHRLWLFARNGNFIFCGCVLDFTAPVLSIEPNGTDGRGILSKNMNKLQQATPTLTRSDCALYHHQEVTGPKTPAQGCIGNAALPARIAFPSAHRDETNKARPI